MPNFRFWIPLDKIEKSVNDKGQRVMKIGGMASTSRKDTDKESLDPTQEGFDISYLKEKGIINWNHSKSPEAIIGEPTKVEFRPKGLYVESELYEDSVLANKVYDLAETLQKNSKKRRLGYSIEGKVIERDCIDDTKVTKAMITNIALTISPKNPDSIVDIMKGEYHELTDEDLLKGVDDAFDTATANGGEIMIIDIIRQDGMRVTVDQSYNIKVEKCLDTDKGRSLIKEDVDPKLKIQPKYLSKAEVFDKIFADNSVISFETANEIFKTLNNLTMSQKTDKKTEITEDVLEKALKTLKITKGGEAAEEVDDTLEKGEDDDSETTEKEASTKKKDAKGIEKAFKKKAKKDDEDDDEGEGSEEEGGEKGEDDEKNVDTKKKPAFLKKAVVPDFKTDDPSLGELIKSLAIIAKGTYDLQKQTLDVSNEIRNELQKSHDMIEELSEQPVNGGRKSVKSSVKPLNREFNKGIDDDLTKGEGADDHEGKTLLSKSRNKQAIIGLLDKYTFEKGFDNELGKALTTFEAGNELLPAAMRKLAENNIEIIN